MWTHGPSWKVLNCRRCAVFAGVGAGHCSAWLHALWALGRPFCGRLRSKDTGKEQLCRCCLCHCRSLASAAGACGPQVRPVTRCRRTVCGPTGLRQQELVAGLTPARRGKFRRRSPSLYWNMTPASQAPVCLRRMTRMLQKPPSGSTLCREVL